jgi:hypothetical protein
MSADGRAGESFVAEEVAWPSAGMAASAAGDPDAGHHLLEGHHAVSLPGRGHTGGWAAALVSRQMRVPAAC